MSVPYREETIINFMKQFCVHGTFFDIFKFENSLFRAIFSAEYAAIVHEYRCLDAICISVKQTNTMVN